MQPLFGFSLHKSIIPSHAEVLTPLGQGLCQEGWSWVEDDLLCHAALWIPRGFRSPPRWRRCSPCMGSLGPGPGKYCFLSVSWSRWLYLEGNPTVVWIFRSRNENLFRLASLLGALPAHLVGGHTGGGGGHPANLPGLLVNPEVCRSQGPGGEAARQRGGAGLCLASKGSGQVLHLVKTIFSRICNYFLSITWTPYFSPVPTMSGSFEKLKVFLSFPATKYSAE